MNKRIFVSYSRQNQYIAHRLILDLKRLGCTTWFDQHDIPLNEKWREKIQKAIREYDHFLYVWSPEAGGSDYVLEEYNTASKHGKNIAVARVAGNSTNMDPELRSQQHIDLTRDYWGGLRELLRKWLGIEGNQLETSHDLMSKGVRMDSAVETLGDEESRTWTVYGGRDGDGSQPRKFMRIPIFPNGYATSWLVAEETSNLWPEKEIQVVLKFSGPCDRDTVQEVLEYLVETGQQPQIIFIEGPRTKERYEIPNHEMRVWKDCVDLAVKAIAKYCKGRTVHFFLDAPQTVTFPIAARLREMFPYHIYNLNRSATAAERYCRVYSGQPS